MAYTQIAGLLAVQNLVAQALAPDPVQEAMSKSKRSFAPYPVPKKLNLGPGASPQRNGHPDRQPVVALFNANTARASKRSVRRHGLATGQILPKLTAAQKDEVKKRKAKFSNMNTRQEENEGKVKDQTPPFTEAVPNPPLGPAAERIVSENIEAAEQRGADATADGYVKQVEDATKNTAAPTNSSAPDAANNPPAPGTQPEVVQQDAGSEQQGKAPPLQSQGA